jgi:hypothetical protein
MVLIMLNRRLARLIVAFTVAYAAIGLATVDRHALVCCQLWLSPAYQPPLLNQLQLVAQAVVPHVLALLWARHTADKVLAVLSPVQLVALGTAIAVISYLPLVGLSLVYGFQHFSLRNWGVVPALALCWSVGGSALITVASIEASRIIHGRSTKA